jgi:5,10-methylene-tetrahydrofolate dehydrogenase/methenyl tetrahydrofolate cyclohydrolase
VHGNLEQRFLPCTPHGYLELIRSTGVALDGARTVMFGRSQIVGTPMFELIVEASPCHGDDLSFEDK